MHLLIALLYSVFLFQTLTIGENCDSTGCCVKYCNSEGIDCKCRRGYYLDKNSGECIPHDDNPMLVYITQQNFIAEMAAVDLIENQTLLYIKPKGKSNMRSVNYDVINGTLYVVDVLQKSLFSYNLHNSSIDVLQTYHDVEPPLFVRYDWIAEDLYLVFLNETKVCRANGEECDFILSHNNFFISDLLLAPLARYIFWNWLDNGPGTVHRVSMDGTEHKLIILSDRRKFHALTIDHNLERLYWLISDGDRIHSSDFDGKLREKHVLSSKFGLVTKIAVYENYFYFVNDSQRALGRCSLTNESCIELLKFDKESHIRFQDMIIMHKSIQPTYCIDIEVNGTQFQYCRKVKEFHAEDELDSCKHHVSRPSLVYVIGNNHSSEVWTRDLENNSSHMYFKYTDKSMIRSLDYDVESQIFYFIDVESNVLFTYDPRIDSKDVLQTFSKHNPPTIVRRDWITKNLYFVYLRNETKACDGNAEHCHTVISHNGGLVSNFVIAPMARYMFWNLLERRNVGILYRADLDGSNQKIITVSWQETYHILTVDHVNERLYWVFSNGNEIRNSNFDGHKIQRTTLKNNFLHISKLATYENFFYFENSNQTTLSQCSSVDGRCTDLLKLDTNEHRRIQDFLIIPDSHQAAGKNHCLNSGCSQLCLPNRLGFSCKYS